MVSNKLQLVCTIIFVTLIHSVQCQTGSTATENGIVSAAGSPVPTQSVSYLIEGTGLASSMPSYPTATTTRSTSPIDGSDTYNLSRTGDRLSTPAIVGVTLAIVLAVVGIILLSIFIHKRRCEAIAREQRRTILDAEFAPSREKILQIESEKDQPNLCEGGPKIGYFDIAKPLPVVHKDEQEDDRLSRSSTVIADAAEIAKINRKAGNDQGDAKTQRSTTRERNHALQALVGNAGCGDAERIVSLHNQDSTIPVTEQSRSRYPTDCRDGDGDPFTERLSKL